MKRAKGLDDLVLIEGQPRLRAYHRAPPELHQRRSPRPAAGGSGAPAAATLTEARESTRKAIRSFVRSAHLRRGQALVVASPPGTGKTYATAGALAESSVVARVVVGTTSLAQEYAREHGYALIEGRQEKNCGRFAVTKALGENGHDVERLACGTAEEPRCPMRAGCEYYAQFETQGHRVAAAEQMYNVHYLAGGNLLVVDDAELLRSMLEQRSLTAPALARAIQRLDAGPERAVAKLVLDTVLDDGGTTCFGAAAWDRLAVTAAKAGLDIEGLVAALPEPLPHDPVPTDATLSVDDVERAIPGVVETLFATLKEELPAFLSCEDFNSRLRFTEKGLDVWQLREHAKDRRGRTIVEDMAVLVLDATPVEPLVDRLLAGHRRLPDVRERVVLPAEVRVVQVATDGNGHGQLRQPQRLERVVERVAVIRNGRPITSGREAVITYKDTAVAFVRAGFEPRRVMHFGAVRGSNALADVERLFLVGRPMPPTDSILYLAHVIHHGEAVISPRLVMKERHYGGQPWAMSYLDFDDPRASALMKAQRDDEIEQAIHRARLYLADEHRHVEMVVLTYFPVAGLRVDELEVGEGSGRAGRREEARRRINEAVARMLAAGEELDVRRIAMKAKADPRTVEKALAEGAVDLAGAVRCHDDDEPLGTGVEIAAGIEPESAPVALGTFVEMDLRSTKRRLHNVPQRSATSPWDSVPPGSRADRPHWTPCPGGCGWYVPPGQRCFDCASAVAAAWVTERVRR